MTASELRRELSLGCHVLAAPSGGATSAMGVALAHIPPTQLVLGTDHPQQFRVSEPVSRFVVALEQLDHGDLILRRNGERLLRALERA